VLDGFDRRFVGDESRLQLLTAAEVRHARRNFNAAKIDSTKPYAVIGRCRPEGKRDFLA
jgi:hypothetical protein